ncbi:MAG: NAD-dependent epimerase/dehydratase family protein [Bauldia sp.]|nr:NAD-dependent epimerase/dehydratase family protein [Bauldia sp.]
MSGRRLKVLLTGASGFIGRGLVPELVAAGHTVRAALRSFAPLPEGVEGAVIGDLRRPVNLSQALRDIDVVIHSAGLAHAEPGLPEADYRDINATTTRALADAARQAGARRFILMSSVRAQVGPSADAPVTESQPATPTDAYGRSKLEAEQLLADAAIESVVLRPVVVHGPGMRFNMAALYDFARRSGPAPFGALAARRSVLAREHLADAVVLALESDAMAGRTFLVADPEPLTVGEMVAAFRAGLGRRPGLLPVPRSVVRLAARATGRAAEFDRIDSNLVVDPSRLVQAGWRPRRSAREALAATARAIAAEAGPR